MNSFCLKILRHAVPFSVGTFAFVEGTKLVSADTDSDPLKNKSYLHALHWNLSLHTTRLESSKAYDHDPSEFDYYIQHPTVDDLPVLLHKFDHDGLEVWPWIWTHPNENGPHHVFLGGKINSVIVHRIQELRKESPQNNILLVTSGDEAALQQAAKEAGTDASVFDRCHCGVVTGVNLELLNVKNKILMLDDERVIAFDYLTIC